MIITQHVRSTAKELDLVKRIWFIPNPIRPNRHKKIMKKYKLDSQKLINHKGIIISHGK